MIRSNTAQLHLPLDDQLSWDIFNSYAENREDVKSSGGMSTHWTLTAASADGSFPIILEPGPLSASSIEDPYYRQATLVKPQLSRFSVDDEDGEPPLVLKLRRRRKQNLSVDAGRDAHNEEEGLKAILSAAHTQASKSKKAFGKIISQLTNRDDERTDKENYGRKYCLKSAAPVEGDSQSSRHGYFHFVAPSPQPVPPRPPKMRRAQSEFERDGQKIPPPLKISSPFLMSPLPSPPPLGRATTYVRRTKALPLRPSPIPAV